MKKIRVFGHVNHIPHQYEMLKLVEKGYPVEFSYLMNNVRKWTDGPENESPARPIPKHLNWVTAYEKGKYDLAILHIDQQCVNPDIGKGHLYKQLNEVIDDIPKIVIQHGSPDYEEMYTEDFVINGGEVHSSDGTVKQIPGMKELIGDNFMVVNSYEAVNRWGWGYPVIHGMDAEEWWDLPKEPRAIVQLSPGGMDHYNNRQLLSYIKAYTKEKMGMDIQHVTVNYRPKSWDDQRFFLGSSLISITTAKDSPMPRSRTESMLSGCCVMTSKYHNADEFIKHGENGLIMPDNPELWAVAIEQCINENYRDCVEMGQRAKDTAKKLFTLDRYLEDIWKVIKGVAEGNPPKWDGSKIW